MGIQASGKLFSFNSPLTFWASASQNLVWTLLRGAPSWQNKHGERQVYLPVGVAMKLPVWVHPPLDQTLGYHLEVKYGRYCRQSVNKHNLIYLSTNNPILTSL